MDFDTLYQEWAQDVQKYELGPTWTVSDYITEQYSRLQDPDDITDECLFVINYAQAQDRDNPDWRKAYE